MSATEYTDGVWNQIILKDEYTACRCGTPTPTNLSIVLSLVSTECEAPANWLQSSVVF